MNRSNQVIALLLVAALSTVPAFAQSPGSPSPNPGAKSSANPPLPGSGTDWQVPPPVRPDTPVVSGQGPSTGPSVSDPLSPRTSGGLAVPTDSTPRSSSTMKPNSTSPGSTDTPEVNRGKDARAHPDFTQLDSDRDGRVSLTEYSRTSRLNPAASSSSSTSGAAAGSASSSTGGRSGATTGVAGGSQAAQNPAELFRQLDRDSDGYLSRTELEAAPGKSSGGIKP